MDNTFTSRDAIEIAAELTPADWAASALCAQVDPELFFPEKDAGKNSAAEAKRVCMRCEVRLQCLEAHLHEQHGVWGGTSERQRQALRNGREVAA